MKVPWRETTWPARAGAGHAVPRACYRQAGQLHLNGKPRRTLGEVARRGRNTMPNVPPPPRSVSPNYRSSRTAGPPHGRRSRGRVKKNPRGATKTPPHTLGEVARRGCNTRPPCPAAGSASFAKTDVWADGGTHPILAVRLPSSRKKPGGCNEKPRRCVQVVAAAGRMRQTSPPPAPAPSTNTPGAMRGRDKYNLRAPGEKPMSRR